MGNAHGRLFVISAPSGTGKGTIINEILKKRDKIVTSISATTREPREGEKDGEAYYFITKDTFCEMIEKGEFLEHAEFVGNYYGTPRSAILKNIESGIDTILEIDVQGAKQVKASMPEAVMIFIIPPSMDELERRLRSRGTDSEQSLTARLDRAKEELAESGLYEYNVVNDEIARAVDEILAIIARN